MPKNINIPLTKKQAGIVLGFVVVVAIIFFFINANLQSDTQQEQITLEMWGVESSSVWRPLIRSYQQLRPNASIDYRQIAQSGYEEELLNALAAGEGPDIFLLSNRQTEQRKGAITPLNLDYFGIKEFRESFPDVAEQDFVRNDNILALPLYIDTLALFYNKDSLNQAGIAEPPRTWGEFQQMVPQLRSLNAQGQIIKAAAGIGGSEATIPHAVDLLNLLILQNGADIINQRGRAVFASQEEGVGAFEFYTQFADAGSSVYTWNNAQPNALENFIAGDTAMMFGYRQDIGAITAGNPFLRFGIAPMPQVNPDRAINYARYHGLAISSQSENPSWAWDAALHFTTNADMQTLYSNATGNPPALRSVIADMQGDPDLGVFATQTLTATSWPIINYDQTRDIFNNAITAVLTGRADIQQALKQAENQLNLVR